MFLRHTFVESVASVNLQTQHPAGCALYSVASGAPGRTAIHTGGTGPVRCLPLNYPTLASNHCVIAILSSTAIGVREERGANASSLPQPPFHFLTPPSSTPPHETLPRRAPPFSQSRHASGPLERTAKTSGLLEPWTGVPLYLSTPMPRHATSR